MQSVQLSAHKYFLQVDPIYHTTRSSGQIISKIQRGSSSYEGLLDLFTWNLLQFFVRATSVSVALFAYGLDLGLVAVITIIVLTAINVVGHRWGAVIFVPRRIAAEDKQKAALIENLQQVSYIRSTFSSPLQMEKLKSLTKTSMVVMGNAWQSSVPINLIVRTLYAVSIGLISYFVLARLQGGSMDGVIGATLVLSYLNGTSGVVQIGNVVKRLTQSMADVQDLYEFIRGFGKQSFPVLADSDLAAPNKISEQAVNTN